MPVEVVSYSSEATEGLPILEPGESTKPAAPEPQRVADKQRRGVIGDRRTEG
jgi:hypothetical protein